MPKKIYKPTFRKVYLWPHEKQPAPHGRSPHLITDTRGTFFDGNSPMSDKQMNTAPMKARYETLKRHGKTAFRRTLKK